MPCKICKKTFQHKEEMKACEPKINKMPCKICKKTFQHKEEIKACEPKIRLQISCNDH
jgi:transposase-like protein